MNLYVYGFVSISKLPNPRMTLDGHRIEVLSIAGVNAAIERLATRPLMSESALRLQHAIVERLARRCEAVLPARFGSFVPLEELERIVAARRADLRKGLRNARGRIQMTLRIATSPAVDVPDRRVGKPKSGTAYLTARRAALSGPRSPVAAALTDAVRVLVRDERIETDREHGRTSLFHLIDRGDVRRYRAAIDRVPLPEGERITVTGPYAPFAFTPDLWP
jgi:hypothetical protein